jgi:hypothetical protein
MDTRTSVYPGQFRDIVFVADFLDRDVSQPSVRLVTPVRLDKLAITQMTWKPGHWLIGPALVVSSFLHHHPFFFVST